MAAISHTAKFSPGDTRVQIVSELACAACGDVDPRDAAERIVDNKLRIFCERCGAFTTISLTDEQVRAIRRWSATSSAID